MFLSVEDTNKQIEEIINTNYSVTNSKQDFEGFIKDFTSDNSVVDPNELQETVNSFTDRFEQLKFLFLEQEAKEQFLRLILEQNTKHIDRDEVLKSVEEGEELKRISKEKENQINALTSKIESDAFEVHNKIDEIEIRKEESLKLVASIKQSQSELIDIEKALTKLNSDDPTIDRLNNLKEKYESIQLNSDEFSSISAQDLRDRIQEIKNLRSQNALRLQELGVLKDSKIKVAEKTQLLKDEFLTRQKELDQSIQKLSNKIEKKELPEQKKLLIINEDKITVLQQLWNQISFISSFKHESPKIFLKFKGFSTDECILQLGLDDSIESINIGIIEQTKLEKIKQEANESNEPLFKASYLIYNTLREK